MGSRNPFITSQGRIRSARETAQKREDKRKRHTVAYKKNRNTVRSLNKQRAAAKRRAAQLKKSGKHVDAAAAKEGYQILSEQYRRAHRSSKAHARQAYGSGAGKGNFKDVFKGGKKAPKVKTQAELRDAGKGGHVVHYKGAPGRKSRASAPSVGSSKKPKSTTPKVNKLTKEQYKNLVKQRKSQADKNYGNYGTDDAKRKKSAGQKIYNSYDKKIKNSKYSYKSHVAAMKRRGKKATAATYAKFKRYNGI